MLTSKKAKIVLQTSLDLSKQNGGNESFGSSAIARALVRFTNNMVSAVDSILPAKVKVWIEKRFDNREMILEENASFDLIRGSVSIVLASMLIALGTSLKLPLSTTYVTFMVTMGASLSDRAWSRESAVYRVTGMFSVIGGWFITAIVAFLICFLIALLFYFGGVVAMVAMIALAVYIIIKNSITFQAIITRMRNICQGATMNNQHHIRAYRKYNEIVHSTMKSSLRSYEIFRLRLQMKLNPPLSPAARQISLRRDFIHRRWIYSAIGGFS